MLSGMGLNFEVVVSSFEETLPKAAFPKGDLYAMETAKCKALDVWRQCRAKGQLVDVIIGADTVVEREGEYLEKPADAADAVAMLKSLSNCSHEVHTGVALVLPKMLSVAVDVDHPWLSTFSCTTVVEFDDLSDDLIQSYVASGEVYGKAGSYGIQGLAGSFVKGIHGCYFNVVGFPLNKFAQELVSISDRGLLA